MSAGEGRGDDLLPVAKYRWIVLKDLPELTALRYNDLGYVALWVAERNQLPSKIPGDPVGQIIVCQPAVLIVQCAY